MVDFVDFVAVEKENSTSSDFVVVVDYLPLHSSMLSCYYCLSWLLR